MRICSLRLRDFRNYPTLTFDPKPGLNVLVGANAAGKTNALEAIFFSALGKSHRSAHDADLIRSGATYAAIDTTLETRAGTRTIAVRLGGKEKKKLLVDGSPLARSGELMGVLNVVLFSPEDLALVKGGPAERRRFVDMALSQQLPRYYYLLQHYNAALKQRNALLNPDELPDEELIRPFEIQLAKAGAEITRLRRNFLVHLEELAAEMHVRTTAGTERFSLAYHPSAEQGEDQDWYLNRLIETRRADTFRGGTVLGPHRDEVELIINGTNARAFGSQGQQRTAALSLKLAQLEHLKTITGEMPILLLDDVFSELDRARQRLLLAACSGAQTFITCTHVDTLRSVRSLKLTCFHVSNGTMKEEG